MGLDMDWKDRYRLEYNKREVEKRIRSISSIACGFNTSIIPYITDKSGEYSARKAGSFIRELLSGGKRDIDGETIELEFMEGEESFYESFFYCTIRCFANDLKSRYTILEPFEMCTTFQNILDKALLVRRDIRFRNYEALLKNEYYNMISHPENEEFYPLSGFFATIDVCYRLITGKSIETIDKDGFAGVLEPKIEYSVPEYLDEIRKIEAQKDDELGVNKRDVEIILHESDKDIQKEATRTQKELEEREARIRRINAYRKKDWDKFKSNFKDRDKFIEHYRRYRKLFFKISKDDIYGIIESMCTDFLYRKGLLPFLNDDDMADEVIALDKFGSHLDGGIRRRQSNG